MSYNNNFSDDNQAYSYNSNGTLPTELGSGFYSTDSRLDNHPISNLASTEYTDTNVIGRTSQILNDLLPGGINTGIYSTTRNITSNNNQFLSQIEASILRSSVPIELNESEEITVNGQSGIWANKSEVVNWKGIIPIEQYLINEDNNPEIITKKSTQSIEYLQELAIRYLRPPTPPLPGEIIITQEPNTMTPPAPPLVIRQQPARPSTPEPLVIREAPPQPPAQVGRKVITISGKRLPPPPRKVIIERLAPLPSKPQGVMIERWLPYSETKRRVIFQKSNIPDPVVVKPRNVIIQWEAPHVSIKKDIKYLGVIRANPAEYVQRYGTTLKNSSELPQFVLDIKSPQGIVLAADYKYNEVHELEGAVSALNLVDLDKEGLAQYKSQLNKNTTGFISNYASIETNYNISTYPTNTNTTLINEIFSQVDIDGTATITIEEAGSLLLKLNSRLGRSYNENDVRSFMNAIDTNRDGLINLQEFRKAFERIL